MRSLEKRPGEGSLSTNDLLARARQLTRTATEPTSTPESLEPAEDEPVSFEWMEHRGRLLTHVLQDDAVERISTLLADAYEDHADVITGIDGTDLPNCGYRAIFDLCWRFADWASPLTGAEEFLAEMNVPVPDELGRHSERDWIDVQRLVALTMMTVQFGVIDEDEDPLLDVVSTMTAVLLGCGRAWHTPMTALDLVVVREFLTLVEGWLNDPSTLDVWENPFFAGHVDPLEAPDELRVIMHAAVQVDAVYADWFTRLDNTPV